jgi:hypothetical protein
MKKFDTNNTSMIEFEEFTSVLINDPYKWLSLYLKLLIS